MTVHCPDSSAGCGHARAGARGADTWTLTTGNGTIKPHVATGGMTGGSPRQTPGEPLCFLMLGGYRGTLSCKNDE